jgi:putative aminopeptidase FrvX
VKPPAVLLLLVGLNLMIAAGCARPGDTAFSPDVARGHVDMLAGTIGSRPVGTPANDRAREYVVDQLRELGFDVRVQTADARRPELGLTVRVHNVIAVMEGPRREAIALVSHYDSSPFAPGGADDGLGVAVSLEAARTLLAGGSLQHTLAVVVTDGEEVGLMGAAAFNTDPFAQRLGVYVNIEAVGSAGPALLFETGPANGWVVDAWARSAPQPRGGSFVVEVYERIPNDTDFSILKRLGVPGLNFAVTGDGYAYHTARDTAERLSQDTIAHTGHTVVRTVEALDRMDITRRTMNQATYGDLLGRTAFTMGPGLNALLTGVALVLGLLAWGRSLRASIGTVGGGRFLLTAVWTLAGAVLVLAAMIGAAWLLRASREVYHPWYARPERLFILTALMGALAGWGVARLGALLPHGARGTRHPMLAWAFALPVWIGLAGVLGYFAPAAAYLMTIPLLAAAVLLLGTPTGRSAPLRVVSLLSFAVNATLWGWILLQLLDFAVAHFGRMAVITPAWIFGVLMFVGAIVLAPPVLASLTGRPLRRPGFATALLLVLVAAAAGWAYIAPAYTYEQPLRRFAWYVQDSERAEAVWQVASVEPGLDLVENAPFDWTPVSDAPPAAIPLPRPRHPFVFRAMASERAAVPARVTIGRTRTGDVVEFTVAVTPSEPGLSATFVMPEGVKPERPNLPGVVRRARWMARFGAVPSEGTAFRAAIHASDESRLDEIRVLVASPRLPGGVGWQGLPPWLPQERTVWSSEAAYIVQPLPEVAVLEGPVFGPAPPI